MTQDKTIRDAKIDGYLSGLSWALAGSDPAEREETLASIREHLEDSLPTDASPEQVDQAIAALGPASAIAAESTPGYQPSVVQVVSNPTDWSAVMILAGGVASLFLIPLMPLAAILAVVILVAGIMKLRSKLGNRAMTKGGMVAAGLTLIMLVIIFLGLAVSMDVGSETGTQEIIYQQD
ncbi:hypothetical protein V5R04_11970 [Jonesiaceae bacterium BS-20]|uniref:DUF4190 domain-containing protein n=1 Tax=Jonesiaceae bacterium BS-20 TaxID=3120821 RepID=A0AAU7DSK9_9MICO